MKQFKLLMVSCGLLALGGCQTFDAMMRDIESINIPAMNTTKAQTEELTYSGNCPRVDVVEELRNLVEFDNQNAPSKNNITSTVTIADAKSSCTYDQRSVTMDLKLVFNGALGPIGQINNGDKRSFSYPFFVAVTTAGGEILAKEIFAAGMTYEPGQTTQTYYESMRQIIPVETTDSGSNYKILIGFQLGPDQLAYNRAEILRLKKLKEAQERAAAEAAARAKAQAEAAAKAAKTGKTTLQPIGNADVAPVQSEPILQQPATADPANFSARTGSPIDITGQ